MEIKNHGVTVDCGRCEYTSSDEREIIEVRVPLSDVETGIGGTATLLCSVSSDRHEVKLKEWIGPTGVSIRPPANVQRNLSEALGRLSDQRICGNHQICPADVVRIVEKLSRR